jgi:membrane protein
LSLTSFQFIQLLNFTITQLPMSLQKVPRLIRDAFWRALQHDAFGVAKGAAYSSIISLFPAFLLVASIVAASHPAQDLVHEIADFIVRAMPPGSGNLVHAYFSSAKERPMRVLVTTSLITLWTSSGVIVSWMEGFRNAYQIPRTWGLIKERLISFGLVIMAGIPLLFATVILAFGREIELWAVYHAGRDLGPYIFILWTLVRWIIAALTSMAVMLLIYHHAVPRTQPWHSVLPGAALATSLWFPATVGFGWYVEHLAGYNMLYGSFATAIVLLVWTYIISVIVLLGAEFNAQLFPRFVRPELCPPAPNVPRTRVGVG